MQQQPAILIVGHGSRDPAAIREFLALEALWRAAAPERLIACGFLEFARPVIQEAIDHCGARGARALAIVPAILTAARHIKDDIPSELHEARRRHPELALHFARPLHPHAELLGLARARIAAALAGADPAEAVLLVVGRGTSDPDANGEIHKVARMLWEGMGFGWALVAYSGLAVPTVSAALTHAARLGYRHIVVFPYFLFTGVLVRRIAATVAAFAASVHAPDVRLASHLGADPRLVRALAERADEAIEGAAVMNCGLCRYRVPIPGHEAVLGAPQIGHHHAVRGTLPDLEARLRHEPF